MAIIKLYDVIKRMRQLSEINVPFSFEYITCDLTKGKSNGLKKVDKALLRKGMSTDRSVKSETLIGYTDMATNQPRWFYLPLLMKFNGHPITP